MKIRDSFFSGLNLRRSILHVETLVIMDSSFPKIIIDAKTLSIILVYSGRQFTDLSTAIVILLISYQMWF